MQEKKVFLAAPFASYLDAATNLLKQDKKRYIKNIIKVLEENGYSVSNAHTREVWGKEWMGPEECTPLDFKEIKKTDLLVAIPGDPASGGVHIELGWASALGKQIVVLIKEDRKYSNLVCGLNTISSAHIVSYSKDQEGLDKLSQTLRYLEGVHDKPFR